MSAELPAGFTNKYICRGCVNRKSVIFAAERFIVNCFGEPKKALLRSRFPSFHTCPHRISAEASVPVCSTTDALLKEVNAYAIGLKTQDLDYLEKVRMVQEFEAQLRLGAFGPDTPAPETG